MVRKVASISSGPWERLKWEVALSGWFCGRLKDSGMGASGKSTQKAFMFMPYRKPAKLSEKRARLSCISCSCIKFCSRSAMASLSSANPSWRPSSAIAPDAEAARPRWELSRRLLREEARKGVVGRLRGDLLRARRQSGVCMGVVEAMAARQTGI